jgi:hypothetical protein
MTAANTKPSQSAMSLLVIAWWQHRTVSYSVHIAGCLPSHNWSSTATHVQFSQVNCCWSLQTQLFLLSSCIRTHNLIYARSKTIYVFGNGVCPLRAGEVCLSMYATGSHLVTAVKPLMSKSSQSHIMTIGQPANQS